MPSFTENTPLPRLPVIELPPFLEFLKLKSFPLKTFPAVNQPKRINRDTLYIYGPGNEKFKDSFDTYFKFCNIDADICYSNEPNASPSNKLPFFATVNNDIYLGDHNDESIAFISMIKSKLHAAWLFSIWLESLNYKENTIKVYFGHNPSPIDLIMADRDILTREEIYSDATLVLEALSDKLGDNQYFFGFDEPTWLDAVVFSYLHVILSLPHIKRSDVTNEEKNQAATLKKLVQKHDNLVQYAKHICKTYYE
ncbi:unnamed protein product [Cunninghamella blakesleeana]